MQVVLVMFRPDGERRSFSVVRDMTVIGRREDCDLRIPLGDVSRKHCRLLKEDQSVRVEDLGSSNGTYHNGQRVQEASLAPGDTLQVGPVNFMVQIDGVPADEDMQPAPAEPGKAAEDFPPVTEAPPEATEPGPPAPAAEDTGDLVDFDFDEEPTAKDNPA